MKKIITFLFPIIFFLMMCTSVCAAGTISTLDVEVTTNSVTVSGTVASVNAAVAVQVLDSGDNIVAMDSFTVLNDTFAGTISDLALTAGGTYTVRVADYDGGTWKTKSTTAVVPTISVTSVALNQTTGTLTTAGQTLQLTATVSPANASNTAVTWSSSNPSVATVDTTGKVTAVANGTATITVTTADQNKTATATIKVAISSGSDTGSGSGGGSGSGSGSNSGSSGSSSSGGTTTPAPTTPAETEVTTPTETENTTTATTTRRPAATTEENNEETASETKIGVASEDGAEGWTEIKTEINDKLTGALETEEGEELVVAVEMNGEDTVPSDVFEAIEGQDITVTFDMGNGIVWAVNGMDVTVDAFNDINFAASTGEGVTAIPVALITSLVNNRFSMELTLEYEGEFGLTAVMSVNVKKENAGKYANLFYFNPQTETMEYICSAQIKEDGTADLTFTHASDYVIVVDEVIMSVADNTSMEQVQEAAPQETPVEMSSVEKDTAENDSFNLFWIIAVGILILVVGTIAILAVKKKKE